MAGVFVFQAGLVVLTVAVAVAFAPSGTLGLDRIHAIAIAAAGLGLLLLGAFLPARARRARVRDSILDDYVPAWQFGERHGRRMAAPPERVYAAIRATAPEEIRFFQTLTWLRRLGRPLPPGILDAPPEQPIIDTAVRGGFVLLAEQPPQELVVGTVVMGQHRLPSPLTPATFAAVAGPGFTKAAMNFRIVPDGTGGSNVTTETRVYATDADSARRFAMYWRIIQPGSAFIRRMWLRAIRARAEGGSES